MSASRNATAWCSAIGRPNCTRSLAYCVAYSSAARASPVAAADERHARAVEDLHQAAEALALLPQPPVVGDEAVREEQLGVEDRALAHLAHRLPEREPLVVAVRAGTR